MKDWINKEQSFHKYHGEQITNRKHNDIFFIWMSIVLLSVLAANLFLGLTPINLTGLVTGGGDHGTGYTMLGSLFLVFVNIFIVGMIYSKVTKRDY